MARVRTVSLVSIPRLEIVEVVLTAGFDGVLIDLEHGPMTVSDLPPLVAAARAFGADCLVRVDSSHSEAIGRALDVGVTGIVVPHIAKAEAAAHAVEVAKFSGGRGFNPFVRAGGYGARTGFVEDADDEIEVICMIEGVSGLANALEIMQVQGVNTVFLGPYDMSVALGHPGETGHPEVVAAIEGVIRIAESERVSVGVFSATGANARWWREKGADILFIGVDAAVLREAYEDVLDDFAGEPTSREGKSP